MGKKCLLFVAVLLRWIVYIYGRQPYKLGEIQYAVRISNLSDCTEHNDKPLITEAKLITNEYTQYVSAKLTVVKPIILNRIMIHIERCRDYQYACEDFQTWNISSFCPMVLMKNQMWTTIVNSVTPKIWQRTCPHIDKGVYEVHNVTIDVDAFLRFYTDALKYHWRGKSYSYNKKNELLYCIYVEVHAYTYRKRRRDVL